MILMIFKDISEPKKNWDKEFRISKMVFKHIFQKTADMYVSSYIIDMVLL